MGLLDKISSKTISKSTNRMADKISDGIVNSLFGKKNESTSQEPVVNQPATNEAPAVNISGPTISCNNVSAAPATQTSVNVTGLSQELNNVMGMAYNTKRCPNCNSVCVNSPVTCPYCNTDIRSVKPMTPEELSQLQD